VGDGDEAAGAAGEDDGDGVFGAQAEAVDLGYADAAALAAGAQLALEQAGDGVLAVVAEAGFAAGAADQDDVGPVGLDGFDVGDAVLCHLVVFYGDSWREGQGALPFAPPLGSGDHRPHHPL
jgi:hypothetical protein